MTKDTPPVSQFASVATIFAAFTGFSLLFLFALSAIVNSIYYAGAERTASHSAPKHDPKPAANEHKTPPAPKPEAAPVASKPAPAPADTGGGLGQMLAAADVKKGAKVAKKCAACHTFNKGGKNKVGPNLFGILGHQVAAGKGFKYSKAMKSYAASAKSWSYVNLGDYLQKPKKIVPKTKMAFAGLKKPRDIANILVYMREQADEKLPLPQP